MLLLRRGMSSFPPHREELATDHEPQTTRNPPEKCTSLWFIVPVRAQGKSTFSCSPLPLRLPLPTAPLSHYLVLPPTSGAVGLASLPEASLQPLHMRSPPARVPLRMGSGGVRGGRAR